MKVKDIVGINAAMISGVFISLSLAITNIDKTEREAIFHLDRQVLVAYLVIASFSSSSVVAIIAQFKKSKPSNLRSYGKCINSDYANIIGYTCWDLFEYNHWNIHFID